MGPVRNKMGISLCLRLCLCLRLHLILILSQNFGSFTPFTKDELGCSVFTSKSEYRFETWGAHADRYDRATDPKKIIDP